MNKQYDGCPGAANIKGTPSLKEKSCPVCGAVIEIFSSETQAECECGFVAYNEEQGCIRWCRFARDCIGGEAYDRFIKASLLPTGQ
ncbi:MAG: hypothetical protein FWE82_01080 [Defluviitaleaceae bacterium]|nr:hypothetical protein [Defluviitaleaceae bacterium]